MVARSCLAGAVAAGVLFIVAGCQTEQVTSDGRRMPPRPHASPAVPAGAVPNRMTLLVGPKADDSNGNGYPDVVHAVATLFVSPPPTAVEADGGAFEFTLYRQGDSGRDDATPLGKWRFEGKALDACAAIALYGRCYQFRLGLLDHGTDEFELMSADLRGRFEPAGGGSPVLASNEVRLVQIGRR